MVKKIIKNKMQNQKQPPVIKEKKQIKKKKYVPKDPEKEINEVSQLTKKVESINLHDDSETHVGLLAPQRNKSISKKKNVKKTPEKKSKKSQTKVETKSIEDENLQIEHRNFLTTLCPVHSSKYQSEKLKEKPLSFEWYKQIKSIWKSQKEENPKKKKLSSKPGKQTILKKTQKITDVQNITVELMRRLKPKHWLNDEVINSYIELIELDFLRKNFGKKEEWNANLVKTYFAALKMTPERIERERKKRNLSQKSLLIIPINEDYHWFFLIIFEQKMFIFDSILSVSINQQKYLKLAKKVYSMKESVKRCIQLYQKLYQIQEMDLNQMIVVKDYPQQDNENDCGMMMLCGIKNVIVRFQAINRIEEIKEFMKMIQMKEFWNFCIHDIIGMRFIFAREIMEERLFIQ